MALLKVPVLLAAAFGCAEAATVIRVSPEVSQSSSKFFKKDYPWDARPAAGKEYAFGHPYPVVQDSGAYASDYVKDENSDDGSWQAQMEYDTLRAKLRKQKKQAEEALKRKEQEWKELQKVRTDEEHAESDAAKARAKATKARSEADQAKKDVDALDGAEGKGGVAGRSDSKLDRATDKVRKETSDLEKCKKELEEAKKKLEQLVKEKEELERKEGEDQKIVEKFRAGKYAEAVVKADTAKEELKESKAKEDQLEAEEAHLKKEMEEEEKEHAEAKAKHEEMQAKVKSTKADLEKAEDKLRALRGEPAGHHSAAVRPVAALLAVLASLVCAFVY